MSFLHILRVLLGVILAGVIGWLSLIAFNFVKIWQQFEAFEAAAPNDNLDVLPSAMQNAINTMQGGSAVFIAAAIAGVMLGEVFRTRSLVFYAGATGALTAGLASAFWQEAGYAGATPAMSALALSGFVAGGIYWLIASPSSASS